jgi:predicted DNA-binding transcriptional regulator YafY
VNRTDRLTGIILALQHRHQTAAQLAERFEVSRRTILRDIDALSQIGVPVIAVSGSGGGYSLAESQWLKPVQLSSTEATALLLAAQAMTTHLSAPFATATLSAVDKLRTALRPNVLTEADRELSSIEITTPRRSEYLKSFDILRSAIASATWLNLDYQSLHRHANHLILPLTLTSTDGLWYCTAISAAARAKRQFRVDRMLSLSRTTPPPDRESIIRDAQAPPSDYDAPDHPEIVATLTYRGARLAEDLPHAAEGVHQTGDDTWEMRFRCPPSELDYWARTFFAFGHSAHVSAPFELVDAIRELIAAITTTYRIPTQSE